jgi:hypothetical protein
MQSYTLVVMRPTTLHAMLPGHANTRMESLFFVEPIAAERSA